MGRAALRSRRGSPAGVSFDWAAAARAGADRDELWGCVEGLTGSFAAGDASRRPFSGLFFAECVGVRSDGATGAAGFAVSIAGEERAGSESEYALYALVCDSVD